MPRNPQVNQQMRAHSRAKILSAARRLFAERGYFDCSVSNVAHAAGMSQGNLYWHFPSKDAILAAIFEEGFNNLENLLREVVNLPGTGREKIDVLVERLVAYLNSNADFTIIALTVLAHGGAPFLKDLGLDPGETGARYHRLAAEILSQARAEGAITDLDPDLHAVFLFSLVNGLAITYGPDLQQVPDEAVVAALRRLLGVPVGTAQGA